MKIKSIKAREILDSKGMPTIEVDLVAEKGKFKASVPSGVSTGKYEAVELRDADGGVKKALKNIEKIITPVLQKKDLKNQKEIDEILIKLDGTKNKSKLGANAILAISMAVCRAFAAFKNLPLYQYLSDLAENSSLPNLPKPSFNMIEGGKHAENNLAFQEFMIVPQKAIFKENLNIGKEVYKSLGEILEKKFGKKNIGLSREGAFTAPIKKITDAFDLILEAAEKAGYKKDIRFAIDAAASSFFGKEGYRIDNKILLKEKLIYFYKTIIEEEKYPFVSVEDPFEEEDFMGFPETIQEMGEKLIIFGDDLLASNTERIELAHEKGTCNGLILKPNQVGTVSEAIEAAKLAKSYNWKIMVSNRAGETDDDFIADLAVGVGAEFIKSGAPFPKERMAKYNRLVKIEEEIRSES